eukprot:2660462-Pleurochrysis_carterae.AAC.1
MLRVDGARLALGLGGGWRSRDVGRRRGTDLGRYRDARGGVAIAMGSKGCAGWKRAAGKQREHTKSTRHLPWTPPAICVWVACWQLKLESDCSDGASPGETSSDVHF